MALTLEELKEKLAMLDEVLVLEILNLNATDLIDRFEDIVMDKADALEKDLEEL